ncbi:MAG: hypothetical protein M1832_005025 [Thelocarpon impressellum]|nr:MAG: hypothetical protein M1832_005025 [Thelocarpon impressellum]
MDAADNEVASRKRRRLDPEEETGPYILRTLIDNVPLTGEGESDKPEISCVEVWEGNLYVGTSAAEILHFVLIPSDPDDASASPTPILASRLQPPHAASAAKEQRQAGIQQIIVLPKVNKACILCNGTLTFYSLPELSPAFGTTKVRNCNGIGGIDLDLHDRGTDGGDGEHMMISFKDRIQLVRVGESEKPRSIKNIDYPGSLLFVRRGPIACVATSHSYALLDVDHQQKIPLFSISSLNELSSGSIAGQVEDVPSSSSRPISKIASSVPSAPATGPAGPPGHGRSTSLGALVGALGMRQQSPRPPGEDQSSLGNTGGPRDASPGPSVSPSRPSPRPAGHDSRAASPEKPLPLPPPERSDEPANSPAPTRPQQAPNLKPHILSPRSNEFLLTTGTAYAEAGVGMFVNADGDVFRSTLQFERYPEALVIDGRGLDARPTESTPNDDLEGYVLAVMRGAKDGDGRRGLEIQRWDVDAGEDAGKKSWMDVLPRPAPSDGSEGGVMAGVGPSDLGIRQLCAYNEVAIREVGERLSLFRLRLSGNGGPESPSGSIDSSDSRTKASLEQVSKEIELFESRDSAESGGTPEPQQPPLPRGWEAKRRREEDQFARSFGTLRTRIVVWSGDRISWMVRNPMAIRLDAALASAGELPLDRRKVVQVLNSVRGQEPRTEAEFLSLGYIRQKASLLLFTSLVRAMAQGIQIPQEDRKATEEALVEGGLDPRVILATLPTLREEVVEGRMGIWIHGGIKAVAEEFLESAGSADDSEGSTTLSEDLLRLLQSYLSAWRRKKGFGSVADEVEVFRTVDAALLRVLLHLDALSPPSVAPAASFRVELYALVDQGVDCFDRAIDLLEESGRLYVLSRLYQSRKMSSKVLQTWRRILEGPPDEDGEFADGELEVRKYLSKIRQPETVQSYGTWLANRNSKLGVQVFADEKSRVRFEPAQVIQILRRGAPDAVKEYLEHLVFAKQNTQYTNDLIAHYLDTVLSVLESSESARLTLIRSYETYRALHPPRPSYRHFISDNATGEEWWGNRLRLLQLLGGTHGVATEYDVAAVLGRIEPFEQELVPEMIILDGRQGRHAQALRLLTHGLGDFDTAINYCLLGGSSIYRPGTGPIAKEAIPTREEQASLFGHLLSEFLRIEDADERVEQTGNLLERFGGWYDVQQVLSVIPDSWSIELIAPFLISAFRRIVHERNETMVAKALSGSENLMLRVSFIDECEKVGPAIEAAE